MQNNPEILLKVENLCQYFKMGKGELKAVDNVSFDIKKGEVFGLVGESGCGKTTTGRSIIKLYDITDGTLQPVVITDTECQYKTFRGNGGKLTNYAITVELAQDMTRR